MSDAMINSMPAPSAKSTMPPPIIAVPPTQKKPGTFARIFGNILGGAIGVIAPGIGRAIGGYIGGYGNLGGGIDYTNIDTMMQRQQEQSMQMLTIQNQVQTQTQEFTTVTNLLKARHDGEMSAVHNFKS